MNILIEELHLKYSIFARMGGNSKVTQKGNSFGRKGKLEKAAGEKRKKESVMYNIMAR